MEPGDLDDGRPLSMESYFETSPARAYFKQLERWFIELRGAPLQLAPDDYQVAKAWFQEGIPLDLVQEEIGSIVARAREQEQEVKRRLRYYSKAVERAFEQRSKLHAPGHQEEAPPLELGRRLSSLAAAVPEEIWSKGTREEIRQLSGAAEAIEDRLAELEDELLVRAEQSFDSAQIERFQVELSRALDRLRDRMPGGDMVSARERLRRQILRRFLNLPEMSLFGLEATGGPDE